MTIQISQEAKTQIRSLMYRKGYTHVSVPIEVIEGNEKPIYIGEEARYMTKSGKPVYYPQAYMRAWGKPIRIPSTHRIVVGRKWLSILEIDLLQLAMSKERGKLVDRSLAEFKFNFC
jgi:hypothetical protein